MQQLAATTREYARYLQQEERNALFDAQDRHQEMEMKLDEKVADALEHLFVQAVDRLKAARAKAKEWAAI